MKYHRADAKNLLDDRGYHGPLIRGQNPALLVDKGVRDRIVDSLYWKEQCFGLNAATLCDRAADLSHLGGTYGPMGRPTAFLCLLFKMLTLVPNDEIVLEYLNFEDKEADDEDDKGEEAAVAEGSPEWVRSTGEFKYLRALAAFYIRLAWDPVDIYKTLEPLLADFRKIKRRTKEGFRLSHVDEFIDDLLTKPRVCATSLWKLPGRTVLEDEGKLEPRESPLGAELDELDRSDEEQDGGDRRSESSEGSASRRTSDSPRRGSDSD